MKLQLHHVGYAVSEIEPMTELYLRRYGYEAASGIIHDGLQTALVQFLRLPGDQTYIEFVAPDGSASKLSSVARRGGGLHHLCYTCGLLEEMIVELEGSGMRLISDAKVARALGNRRICWLMGADLLPVELVERRDEDDLCAPGLQGES